MPRISSDDAGGANRCAFLDMIAVSELLQPVLNNSDDGYNTLVGSTAVPLHVITFPSYAAHPNILNRALNSTAAGRYQILYKFWPYYQNMLNLPDFGPESQDRYALQQMHERHALPLLDAGNFAGAVAACNNIWASLTGSPYGQHTHPIEFLQQAYVSAGGIIRA